MRVLFVDQFSQLGGAQMMLRDVLAEGLRRGWHSEVIVPGNGALIHYCKTAGIRSYTLPIGKYSSGAKTIAEVLRYGVDITRAARAIKSIVSHCGIDLVVANGPRILPALATVSCPVAFHLHSRPDKRYASLILRWCLRWSQATVVCCSKFVASALDYKFARVIYNGVEDCGFSRESVGNAAQRVAIVGRIAPEKGHRDFIGAAEIVGRSRPDVRFTIHGESLFSDPSFETHLRAMKMEGNVEFHGWTDDVASVLHRTDILVLPSTSVEATPRVIMEAFSAGTPVIAYPSGGVPEIVRHGETGLLTERCDNHSLAETILRLLSNRDLMTQFARNGRDEWEKRFRLDRFQREVCDLLEWSAEKRGKPQAASAIACKNDFV